MQSKRDITVIMEAIYSSTHKGYVVGLHLTNDDRALFINALKSLTQKQKRAIRDIENNPNNEGQATYLEAKRQRRRMISLIEDYQGMLEQPHLDGRGDYKPLASTADRPFIQKQITKEEFERIVFDSFSLFADHVTEELVCCYIYDNDGTGAEKMQAFLLENMKGPLLYWSTAIGIMSAVDLLVEEAVSNGNIQINHLPIDNEFSPFKKL